MSLKIKYMCPAAFSYNLMFFKQKLRMQKERTAFLYHIHIQVKVFHFLSADTYNWPLPLSNPFTIPTSVLPQRVSEWAIFTHHPLSQECFHFQTCQNAQLLQAECGITISSSIQWYLSSVGRSQLKAQYWPFHPWRQLWNVFFEWTLV